MTIWLRDGGNWKSGRSASHFWPAHPVLVKAFPRALKLFFGGTGENSRNRLHFVTQLPQAQAIIAFMPVLQPLNFSQQILKPGAEWTPAVPAWHVAGVARGIAYWIGVSLTGELSVGHVIFIPPGAAGMLRASQLTEVQIQIYFVSRDILSTFLTLAEHQYLEALAAQANSAVRQFQPDHPVAVQFARLTKPSEMGSRLRQRCELLQLFAEALFDERTSKNADNQPRVGGQAVKRFRDLITSLSQNELLKFSAAELACKCGCSLRHLTRIFRAHFGQSLRAKLTTARMNQARDLLINTPFKVSQVAHACGYPDTSLFGATFKKQFGASPRKWRALHARSY
jgi:AraC-like DNA-binding protein